MDATTAITQTSPQPKLISQAEWEELEELDKVIETAKASLPSGATTSPTHEEALRKYAKKIEALALPSCPIKCIVWTQRKKLNAEPTCLKLFTVLTSLPAPQKLLDRPLPENGVLLSLLRQHVPPFDPGWPCFMTFEKEEGFDFFGNHLNQERVYGWLIADPCVFEEVNLETKGKALAQEWFAQLQNTSPPSLPHYNLYCNLHQLLSTLAKHKSCFFTEQEFALFMQPMNLSAEKLIRWTEEGFICSNFSTSRLSLTNIICALAMIFGLALALSYVPHARRWTKTLSH